MTWHPLNSSLKVIGIFIFLGIGTAQVAWTKPYRIQVIDQDTSRGIPLVILETSLGTRHVTDSNGLVAYNDPVGLNREIFFKPVSDGYSYPAPGLAMGGMVLKPRLDSSATIVMKRDMIAERLYRITGAGIYKDTVALGEKVPIEHPLINAGVVGQDSALCTSFHGRLLWLWGDTSRSGHPLSANFRTTCAFSDFPDSGGLPVDRGINLYYITRGDFVKPMMPLRHGKKSEVYWMSCLMNVRDINQEEHILAWWSRIENPDMKTAERGIAEYRQIALEFKPIAEHPTTAALQPSGHAVRHGDYFYFMNYGELTRVRATYDDAKKPDQYEAWTCLKNDGKFTTSTAVVNRDTNGKVIFEWRSNAEPTGPAQQRELVKAGLLSDEECTFRPVDKASDKPFLPHACHVSWNAYRGKWIMLTSELMGSSMLGEIWYLESDRIEGPWTTAVKVLTHAKYSFYNPLQHPELVAADSHYLYFEGTYTKTFSDVQTATPYYDYNQVMYRINLDDSRLR